jgi:hypothetical protein
MVMLLPALALAPVFGVVAAGVAVASGLAATPLSGAALFAPPDPLGPSLHELVSQVT